MRVKIDLSNTTPTLDGELLSDLIAAYLEHLRTTRRVQKTTLRGYTYKLAYFVDWWAAEGPKADWAFDGAAVAAFVEHLGNSKTVRDEPLSWRTQNDALRRLRQVLRWAHRQGHVPIDFSDLVPARPPGAPPLAKPVALDTLAALFDAAERMTFTARNQAMLAVLAGTGIRCEECAALLVENITVYADDTGLLTLTVAKNDKLRTVAFDKHTGRYLRIWLDELDTPRGPLFPSRIGGGAVALTPNGLYKALRDMAIEAGIVGKIKGAHDLRRLFATIWQRTLPGQGYGQLLQKQLGHASFDMTSYYTLTDATDILDVMRDHAVSPLAQLLR